MLSIQNQTEFDAFLQENNLVFVDFTATWCGPCQMIGPKFVTMSEEFQDRCKCIKVDVDDADDVAASCGISAMPTFQVYKGGEKVDELVGASEDKLRALFVQYTA